VGRIVPQRIRESLVLSDDAAEAIRSFIRNIALNVELSGFRAGGPITTIVMKKAATSPTLRQECQRIYGEWQAVFTEKLQLGGQEKQRSEQIAVLIIAAIEGGVILRRTSRLPLEHFREEIYHLVTSTA
jgi:TetR/AcrR family transcriptional repressor of lmrAB and yxaGH operons